MKQKDILIISILTFTVTIIWIVSTIVHNVMTSTINDTLSMQIEPIEPSFDLQTIQTIKSRQVVSPLYSFSIIGSSSNESSSSTSASIAATTTPTPTASESAGISSTITQTPIASSTGTLSTP